MRRLALLVLAFVAAGCTEAPPAPPPRVVMKCPTVPPFRQDAPGTRVPAQPAGGVTMTLAPGHWEWNGSTYDWMPPAWVPRARGRIWQDGYWTASGIACFWTPGRLTF